ncbi:DUF4872 domain-containing protein [Candidatus Bathyarchaeota archaeon]|nr:DUF4872 domain-containing protein [Candidatus Bathyarchaeota archaeon]
MPKLIKIPHKVHASTCYVNGIFDLLTWRGAEYDYFLLPVVGGMASFAYLKFKSANPPCMVYWGNNPKYLLNDLSQIIGFNMLSSEGKAFKNEFPKMKRFLEKDEPVMVGALDMYYLHYYSGLYQKEHVSIHYLLLVGYDDEKMVVYVHDCGVSGVQEISYSDFEKSLNINVPGMSKKNSYKVFTFPSVMPSELEVAEKGLIMKANRMLGPPVSMLGIPAMRKLAKDIDTWKNEDCFKHMVAYSGLTPPLISEDLSRNDGLRFEQSRVLKELGTKYNKTEWINASNLFKSSGELIIQLSKKAVIYDNHSCSELINKIAEVEEKAYKTLIKKEVF